MLREGVLSIAIRADFWQPHAEERKKSGIDQNIGRQRAVFDRMNIQISKQWHTTMSRPFYSDANKAKMCRFSSFFSSSSSSSHFLFPRDFSENIADTNIINTPLERLRPANVHFVGFVDTSPHFGGEIPPNPQFFEA